MATAAQERKKTRESNGLAFTISREKLIEGLERIAPVIPAKATLPVLSNVLIVATGGWLTLAGTDLDQSITTTVAADVESSGSICLPAKRLIAIAKELPPAPVRIRQSKSTSVVLDCGRASFKLCALIADEFPELPDVAWDAGSISGEQLAGMVHRTSFAASSEDGRPILNGILFERDGDLARMVATSGHLLAMVERNAGADLSSIEQAIVPRAALEQVAKLFGANAEVEIGRGENHLGFRSDKSTLVTRLIEGPYPPYRQVFPKEQKHEVVVDRSAFMSALRRCLPVASDEGHRIALSIGGGQVKLHGQTSDIGEVRDELAARINGPEVRVGFNAQCLLNVLKAIDGDEVTLKIKSPHNAVTFEPTASSAPKSLYIVMPVRLLD